MSGKHYRNNKRDADKLAAALTELPENWLMCRDMRHAWTVSEDFHVEKNKGATVQTIKRVVSCLRCETKRVEFYTPNRLGLEKISQHYTYPENYQFKGVPRGIKPSWIIQAEQYRRTMEKAIQANIKSA